MLAGGGQARAGHGRAARAPAGSPTAVLQPAQHHIHRLPGDGRAPGKFGVGQARALVEQLEAGVLRHGETVAAQRGIHRRAQRRLAAAFYENQLGLRRAPASPPGALVSATTPIPLAVRELLPGANLDAAGRPGAGVALWLKADDAQALHDKLAVHDQA